MNIETKAYVVGLLESCQKREKQIELLHYELAHPVRISEDEAAEPFYAWLENPSAVVH